LNVSPLHWRGSAKDTHRNEKGKRESMRSQKVVLVRNRYFDSVFLMAVARRISEQDGIDNAAAVMGSDANKTVLERMGFDVISLQASAPQDLMIAIEGTTDAIELIAADIEQWLIRPESKLRRSAALSLEAALAQQAGTNLAVISVPGEHAAREADDALDKGLNVFLFSDHVSVEDERELKLKASEAGLIVMGPDCGTALIAGRGIGFANVVRQGSIGVVASSGTGLQEFSSLVHRGGAGLSHGIGTGGRDLSDDIGAISTLSAIAALENDPTTRVIAVVSKPPGKETLKRVIDRLQASTKPSVACFLGLDLGESTDTGRLRIYSTIDEAVAAALRLAGDAEPDLLVKEGAPDELPDSEQFADGQRYIRGLFAGGTFCYQAQQVMKLGDVVVHSNAPLPGMLRIDETGQSTGHVFIDMGADEFTLGMPHPMIDATQRSERIVQEAADPDVAVLLLDIVLGYNAASDPAGDLAEAITSAHQLASENGRHLAVVASVCGTDLDPQGLAAQEEALRSIGVHVFPSNVQASRYALAIHEMLDGGG
jgi:FdrA protein